jgi:hypothetical protein
MAGTARLISLFPHHARAVRREVMRRCCRTRRAPTSVSPQAMPAWVRQRGFAPPVRVGVKRHLARCDTAPRRPPRSPGGGARPGAHTLRSAGTRPRLVPVATGVYGSGLRLLRSCRGVEPACASDPAFARSPWPGRASPQANRPGHGAGSKCHTHQTFRRMTRSPRRRFVRANEPPRSEHTIKKLSRRYS